MKSYFFLFDFLGCLCYIRINRGFKERKDTIEMKEIWIDNYSISETAPGHYCISKNGTPCEYRWTERELTEHEMKRILLDYIQGTTEIKVGDSDE